VSDAAAVAGSAEQDMHNAQYSYACELNGTRACLLFSPLWVYFFMKRGRAVDLYTLLLQQQLFCVCACQIWLHDLVLQLLDAVEPKWR
jgi:hypothetical protein